jgi:hypothetical protein
MSVIRIVLVLAIAMSAPLARASGLCGMSFDDWCTTASDGVCGRHPDEVSCRADNRCVAVRYSGESVVACHWDERGFADNCPAVGCKGR